MKTSINCIKTTFKAITLNQLAAKSVRGGGVIVDDIVDGVKPVIIVDDVIDL